MFLLGTSSLVAHANMDDALALRGGRILAGKTAKSSAKSSKSGRFSKTGKALFGKDPVDQETHVDSHGCSKETLPSLVVPHCNNGRGSVTINKRLGTLAADFPEAVVELCFTDKTLELIFQAQSEKSYLVDDTYVNNDPLWEKTVMEAFIATGDHDPTGYLEFEVAPNNNLWTGWIHNPNKDFTSKATAFIDDWDTYPITSTTTRNTRAQTWKSVVSLPLSMFNIEEAEGTHWRMNFFQTYYADESSEQEYGAWNPNKLISFHQTPCFGKVQFAI
jgi:hypothetical protein